MIKISSEKIWEGIEHSLKKSAEHLSGAEALISINNLNDAVVLIEFAIEEFGRAVALREKLRTDSEDVERALFTSHDYKFKKAWSVLPEELKTIYEKAIPEWWSGWGSWWGGDSVQKELISSRTRVDATFVNYHKITKQWIVGIRADKGKLETVIKGIRGYVQDFAL